MPSNTETDLAGPQTMTFIGPSTPLLFAKHGFGMITTGYSSDFILRCSANAHTDKFCRSRDIAGEPLDLRHQIIAFETLARIAQGQRHNVT